MEGTPPLGRFGALKTRKFWLIFAPIVLFIGLSGLIWYVGGLNDALGRSGETVKKTASAEKTYSLLNGIKVNSEIAARRPVAVSIENSPVARPQAGLANADVVYEAVTEGGITRFLGLFTQDLPSTAGPIRSARSYFIDWLSEYDAIYVHAGGSPTALARIIEYKIKDYPHANDGTYTRIPQAGVASEHTLFADIAKIFQNAVNNKKWDATVDYKPWLFKDPAATPISGGTVVVNFSSAQFQAVWTHDAATNLYSRSMAGTAHQDRISGVQIQARTIVIMTVSHSANPPYRGTGKESEWTMATIGTGKVSVFQDGTRLDGSWKKPSRTERTRFYGEGDKEIPLNRGKIWVKVIPQDGSVTVS